MVTFANWHMQNYSGCSQKDTRKRNTDTSKPSIQKCLYSRYLFFFMLLHIFELYMCFNKAFFFFSENDVKRI